jgi:hypothetical protein
MCFTRIRENGTTAVIRHDILIPVLELFKEIGEKKWGKLVSLFKGNKSAKSFKNKGENIFYVPLHYILSLIFPCTFSQPP